MESRPTRAHTIQRLCAAPLPSTGGEFSYLIAGGACSGQQWFLPLQGTTPYMQLKMGIRDNLKKMMMKKEMTQYLVQRMTKRNGLSNYIDFTKLPDILHPATWCACWLMLKCHGGRFKWLETSTARPVRSYVLVAQHQNKFLQHLCILHRPLGNV